jgi:hypothetical protein
MKPPMNSAKEFMRRTLADRMALIEYQQRYTTERVAPFHATSTLSRHGDEVSQETFDPIRRAPSDRRKPI